MAWAGPVESGVGGGWGGVHPSPPVEYFYNTQPLTIPTLLL